VKGVADIRRDTGEGGNGGWGDITYRYIGIVRAVNLFNGSDRSGAVIIEYLSGCYPTWEPDLFGPPPLPFFGIYFRVLTPDCIQMATVNHAINHWSRLRRSLAFSPRVCYTANKRLLCQTRY
jgi:hypothetical protein